MIYPGVAQMVARLLWEQDAAGSNPVTRTKQEVTRLIGKSGRLLLFLYRNYHGNHADSDSAWKPRRVKKSALCPEMKGERTAYHVSYIIFWITAHTKPG